MHCRSGGQVKNMIFGILLVLAAVVSTAYADRTADSQGDAPSSTGGKFPYLPVSGSCIRSFYGWRSLPDAKKDFHSGWDFRAGDGTSAIALGDGTVTAVGRNDLCGKYVEIKFKSPAVYAHYCHLEKANVGKGDAVKGGEVIGKTDSTGHVFGAHLHFVIKKSPGFSGLKKENGITLDPSKYLANPGKC
jgi:murein DD-endopeptidase MepM/ murein hydrolase activator NlpD